MAMQRRASGILVEARGDATVVASRISIRRASLGELRPPQPAAAAGRRRGAAAPPQQPLTEEEAVVNALEAQELVLVDAITIAASAAPPATQGAARRRTHQPPAPAPVRSGAAEVELAVPAAANESVVVLVDQDGVYEWRLPGEERPAQAEPPASAPAPARARRRAPAQAAVPASLRTLVFRIPIEGGTAAAAPEGAAAAVRRPARRGGLLTKLATSKAVVYVFRFAAKPLLQGAVMWLEKNVAEGIVHITAPDPQTWQYVTDESTLAVPKGRAARVLMLVHGTFSSTVGSYGALAGQPEGRAFLQEALQRYDLVIGYDHPTLSVLPTENAALFAKRLERIGFSEPPTVDAVSFSRGGLVLRSLIEHIMPTSQRLQLKVRRAIFVGCTNAGTELANPKNWERLANRYTNLAAAGARAAALVPGFAATGVILASAIRGVGVLVKVLAGSAVTGQAVPGLAAMEPDGPFIREINGAQAGQPAPEQTYYCAITTNFDPDLAKRVARPDVMPPGLLLKLADKAADALYGQPNDLVVHVASMTQIDAVVGSYIREVFDFGTSGTVHHCSYFSQPETAQHLMQWLELRPAPAASVVVQPGAAPRPAAATVVRLRSTDSAGEALVRVQSAGKPWIVVERPYHEDGKAVTLRYAHPTALGEQWLRDADPEARVHDAFNLRETDRSPEVPAGGAAAALAPAPAAALKSTFGSQLRTIEMDTGEPVNVFSPPELEDALAGGGLLTRNGHGRGSVPRMESAEPLGSTADLTTVRDLAMDPDFAALAVGAAPPESAAPGAAFGRRRGQRSKPPAAAAAAAPQVECQFRAETDDEHLLGRVSSVAVTISREQLAAATHAASDTRSATVKANKPLVVECMPMLRVVMDDEDYARVEVPVPAPGQPAKLRFDVRGNEVGSAQVAVQVRQGPMPLVTLTLDFEVVEQRSGTRRPVAVTAGLAAMPATVPEPVDELRIIQVQPAGQKTQYRYELRLPSKRVREEFESPLLDSDPGSYVASIHKRIEDRWAQHRSEKAAFERDLRAIGSELFEELFPLELKQLLWQHRTAIASVQVLSSEPFIPWELVLLHDPAQRKPGPDAGFLGELGVVRWLVSGYPPEILRLRKDKARYVVPTYEPGNELPGAQEEIAMMRKRFGATEVKPEAEAIYRLLEQGGQFDLLHIACHGAANAADIGSAQLVMPGRLRQDGSLSEENVLATTVRRDAELRDGTEQPVVVLNACQSGRGGYTLKGLGGFAKAFIDAGAGLFIGSSWSIGDTPAQAFVDEFYEQWVERGQQLAPAAAAARKKARDDGDATWLAYVVYGHPRAQVARS